MKNLNMFVAGFSLAAMILSAALGNIVWFVIDLFLVGSNLMVALIQEK